MIYVIALLAYLFAVTTVVAFCRAAGRRRPHAPIRTETRDEQLTLF